MQIESFSLLIENNNFAEKSEHEVFLLRHL